jgi:hypothetical protein
LDFREETEAHTYIVHIEKLLSLISAMQLQQFVGRQHEKKESTKAEKIHFLPNSYAASWEKNEGNFPFSNFHDKSLENVSMVHCIKSSIKTDFRIVHEFNAQQSFTLFTLKSLIHLFDEDYVRFFCCCCYFLLCKKWNKE